MDHKYCLNCGVQIPSTSTFCPECGYIQEAAGEMTAEENTFASIPEVFVCKQCGNSHSTPFPTHCRACGYPLDMSSPSGETQNSVRLDEDTASSSSPSEVRIPKSLPKRAVFVVLLIGIIFILGWVVGQIKANEPVAKCSPFEIGDDYELANQNDLRGTLRQNSFMESGKEYAVADQSIFTIDSDTTLIIEPGARLKFGKGAKLVVNGSLLACGTRSRRILFTADARTGTPGYWLGIEINRASGDVIIGHSNFEFGGGEDHAVISVEKSDLTLEDVHFESNKSLSLSIAPDSFPTTISPIVVDNGPEGWEVRGGKLIDDLGWEGEQPLIINGKLEIPKEITLNINAGSHIKFLPDSSLSIYGAIIAHGTPQKRILVTSANDILGDQQNRSTNKTWTGLFFIGDQAQGEFSYVEFQYENSEED